MKQIAKGADPYYRELYSSDTHFGQLWDQVKYNIPGLRNTLPVKKDSLGQDKVQQSSTVTRWLNAAFLPGAVSTYSESEVQAELHRLRAAVGAETENGTSTNSLFPSSTKTKVVRISTDSGSVEIELDLGQQIQLRDTSAALYNQIVADMVCSDYYSALTEDEKVYALNAAMTTAKELAKERLGIGYESSNKLLKLAKAGLTFPEAYGAKQYHDALEDDDGAGTITTKATTFKAWVQKQDWTVSEVDAVLDAYGAFSTRAVSNTKKYDEMTAAGISSEAAERLVLGISKLEPAEKSQARYEYQVSKAGEGETVERYFDNVQTWQVLELIAEDAVLSESAQWSAMKIYSGSKLIDQFRDAGIAPWVYAAYAKAQSEQDTGKWNTEKFNRWLGSMELDPDIKRALRRIYNNN